MLSDLGYMICQFDSSGNANTSTAGSETTFNTVSLDGGSRFALINTEYDSCFSTTFSICKNVASPADAIITLDQLSMLMKWLTPRKFKEFVLMDKYDLDYWYIRYKGAFTAQRVQVGGALVGLQLTFTSNAPYGYGAPVKVKRTGQTADWSFNVDVEGDEEGFVYPDTFVFTANATGNLTITNDRDNKSVYIANCSTGEVITMDCKNKIISSSLDSHKIFNDFNYIFFRLVTQLNKDRNKVTFSLPGTVEFSYSPVRKVVF